MPKLLDEVRQFTHLRTAPKRAFTRNYATLTPWMVFARSRRLVRAVFARASRILASCRAARWKLFMHISMMRNTCSTASASHRQGTSQSPFSRRRALYCASQWRAHSRNSYDSTRGPPCST